MRPSLKILLVMFANLRSFDSFPSPSSSFSNPNSTLERGDAGSCPISEDRRAAQLMQCTSAGWALSKRGFESVAEGSMSGSRFAVRIL